MEIQHLFFPVHPACQEQSELTTAGSSPLCTLNFLLHSLLPPFPPSPPSPLQNPWLAHHFSLLLSAGPWRAGGLTAGQLTCDLWQVLHGVSALQLATTAFLAAKGLMSLASWRLGWNPAGWWGTGGFTKCEGVSSASVYVLLPQSIRARFLLQAIGLVGWLKKKRQQSCFFSCFFSLFLLSIRLH